VSESQTDTHRLETGYWKSMCVACELQKIGGRQTLRADLRVNESSSESREELETQTSSTSPEPSFVMLRKLVEETDCKFVVAHEEVSISLSLPPVYYSDLFKGRTKYCVEHVCFLSVTLSVHTHVWGTTRPNSSTNFPCVLPVATARCSSGAVVIYYVLPVMWMTSCFSHNGHSVWALGL